jgi:hypothetical protein
VAPAIHQRFNELGYHFNGVAPGGYEIRDNAGKTIAEVDIEHHIERLEILREHRSRHNDTRKIQAAIETGFFAGEDNIGVWRLLLNL